MIIVKFSRLLISLLIVFSMNCGTRQVLDLVIYLAHLKTCFHGFVS